MKFLVSNRRAKYDYAIEETIRAGLELTGSEVKSIKTGKASLLGSFVHLRGNQAWLINAFIPPYQPENKSGAQIDSNRSRRLLLNHKELSNIFAATQNGMHIVPLAIHVVRGRLKLDIGLGKSQRKTDKRQRIRKREDDRSMSRSVKRT